MDSILSINQGSSSLKLSLFSQDLKLLKSYQSLESLQDTTPSIIAHRVVHGFDKYKKPTKITKEFIADLKKLTELAPLHNPVIIKRIEETIQKFKGVDQYAIFDTSFFQNMPNEATSYALNPQFGVKRYGFHGIAHEALIHNYLGLKKKIVTLHLGSGSSICAIKNFKPIDTSMGFTPLEGLVMLTRCGDIDPFVVEYLKNTLKKTSEQVFNILNHESGIYGLSGTKNVQELSLNSPAINLFVYRIIKYVGAYLSLLKGIDAIIFSGGIGENSAGIRKKIIDELSFLGFKLDNKKNLNTKNIKAGASHLISSKKDKEIWVIGSDENKLIAKYAKEEFLKCHQM
jgi:acetate kinase